MDIKKNMCNYDEYRRKTRKLLDVLKQIQIRTNEYQKKILKKWYNETKIPPTVKNIRNINTLEVSKNQGNGTSKTVKWIKMQNENIQNTFYALKRVSEIIRKLTLNKIDYTRLQNFLNYSLKNKNTYKPGQMGGRKMGCIVNTEVINEIINKYKNGNQTVNKLIDILYKHKKKNISEFHMFLETVVGLTKNNKYIKPSNRMKTKIKVFNKQVLRTNKGKESLDIKIPSNKISEFFYLMYKDMVHDDTLKTIDDFKKILEIFIKSPSPQFGQYTNIGNMITKYTNFDPLTSKGNADKKSRIKLDNIFNNRQANVSVRTVSSTSSGSHNKTKATRSLIRYLSEGETTKYKKFYVLSDIDAGSILTKFVSKLKTTQVPRGEFLITPANLLDPGGLYWNRDGLAPIAEFKEALKSQSVSKTKIFKFDSTMLDVTINYADEKNKIQAETKIKIEFNPRHGYQILLNNKNISTSTKRSAISHESKLGKFLGDFLLILNTLILQKAHSRPVAFGTSDASAAVIYKFMCDLIPNLKPRLFFSGRDSNYEYLKIRGMENVIVKNKVITDPYEGRKRVINRGKKRVKLLNPVNKNPSNYANATSSNNNRNNRFNLNNNKRIT